MRSFVYAIPLLLMGASEVAAAHPRMTIQAEQMAQRQMARHVVKSHAFTGEPGVRIRNAKDEGGLTPLAFAKWVKAHPRLLNTDEATFKRTSSSTRLLNRTAPLFANADQDSDGRVSPTELADFVGNWPKVASISWTA